MATESSGSSNGGLFFIVGILVVGMLILGFLFLNGTGHGNASAPLERAAGAVSDAADSVGDAAKRPAGG